MGYASLWRMGMCFFFCLGSGAADAYDISVSEINPAEPKPQFQFIRRQRLKVPLHLNVISGDRVVLLDDDMHIYVWNLTSNVAATWKLAGLDPA